MTKPLYSPDFSRELSSIRTRITNLELANYQEAAADVAIQWHYIDELGEPTFENDWVNYGSGYPVARFRKDQFGIVRVTGLVKSGTGDTIFTLPVGYRLTGTRLHMPAISNGAMCQLYVNDDGTVNVSGYSATWVDLSPLSFEVD